MQLKSVEIHSIRWGRSPSRLSEYIQEAEVDTPSAAHLLTGERAQHDLRPSMHLDRHTGTRHDRLLSETDLSLQKHSLPALPKPSVAQRMQG